MKFHMGSVSSGVFKGRLARHLPRVPLFGGPPSGVTRINFLYFWWNIYYSLVWCATKQIISKYSTCKGPPSGTVMCRYFAFKGYFVFSATAAQARVFWGCAKPLDWRARTGLLSWGWYGVEVLKLIPRVVKKLCVSQLTKGVPMSLWMQKGKPKMQNNHDRQSITVADVIFLHGKTNVNREYSSTAISK